MAQTKGIIILPGITTFKEGSISLANLRQDDNIRIKYSTDQN